MHERCHIETGDGWRLVAEHIPPTGPARGAIWLGHAMMVDRRTMDRPAGGGLGSALADAGLHVYLIDLRGHGESGPRPHEGGDWSYDDIVAHDLPAACRWLAERHPNLPRAGLGHSLAGHCGLASLGQEPELPIDAFVSLAANVWLPGPHNGRREWLKKKLALYSFAAATRLAGHYPARRLGSGTNDEAASYVHQFLPWARSGVWGTADGRIDYRAGLSRVECPVLCVLGGADQLICAPASGRWFHAPLPDVEVWEVSAASRFQTDASHMSLVTHQDSRPLWEAIAAWLIAHFKE